jgi:hypothetical protein
MEPASSVIKKFGSALRLSQLLGIRQSTVSRWAYPLEKRGTNGVIPQKHWTALLRAAEEASVQLTLEDLAGLRMPHRATRRSARKAA